MKLFNKCLATVELKDGHKLDCFSLFYTRPKEEWKLLHRTKVLMDDKTYQVLSRYLCKWVTQGTDERIIGVMLKDRPDKKVDKLPDVSKLSLGDEPQKDTPKKESRDDDEKHAPGAESS